MSKTISGQVKQGNNVECWPELVGKVWQEAQDKIKNDYPNITVQCLPDGSMATMDYRTDRVRIFVDGNGIVKAAPMIG